MCHAIQKDAQALLEHAQQLKSDPEFSEKIWPELVQLKNQLKELAESPRGEAIQSDIKTTTKALNSAERAMMQANLEIWEVTEPDGGSDAAIKIMEAFDNALKDSEEGGDEFDVSGLDPDEVIIFEGVFPTKTYENLEFRRKLHSLPSCVGNLVKVKIVSVEHGPMKYLPPDIGKLINLIGLVINKHDLKKLPPEFKNLTELRVLILGGRKNLDDDHVENRYDGFTSFPKEITHFSLLKLLHMRGNSIESLSGMDIQNLQQLEELDLGYNKLKAVPEDIVQLSKLKKLTLNTNEIEHLPVNMGNLSKLEVLEVYNNKLRDLPMSLGQIPVLIDIIYDDDDDDIDAYLVRNILNQCQALREGNVDETFPLRLETWKKAGRSDVDLTGLNELPDKSSIDEWLLRLENTRDFEEEQMSLAKTVCDILATVIENKDFRETFLAQVQSNNTACEDRAAMAFNEIYTSWRLATMPEDTPLKDKLELMTQGAKTLALRAVLSDKINTEQERVTAKMRQEARSNLIKSGLNPDAVEHKKKILELKHIEHEAVEIYLYNETSLNEELNLLTAIKHVRYADAIGNRNWINKADLIKEVNSSFFNQLKELPAFKKEIENLDSVKEIKVSSRITLDEMGALPEREAFAEGKVGDEAYNNALLEFQTKQGELMVEMENKISEVAKAWYEAQLGS